jgi:hypothetical protein
MLLGRPSPWLLVAVVAYVGAFAAGAPLFAYLRYRGWPLAQRCLVAAAAAGLLSALVLVTGLLLGFSVSRFFANPGTVAAFLGVGAAWGLGLGLVAGAALFLLLRGDVRPRAGVQHDVSTGCPGEVPSRSYSAVR